MNFNITTNVPVSRQLRPGLTNISNHKLCYIETHCNTMVPLFYGSYAYAMNFNITSRYARLHSMADCYHLAANCAWCCLSKKMYTLKLLMNLLQLLYRLLLSVNYILNTIKCQLVVCCIFTTHPTS